MTNYVCLKVHLDVVKIDDAIEILVARTKHIPTINSSKKVVKKRPNIFFGQYIKNHSEAQINQSTNGVAGLETFPCATSKELTH